MTDIRIALAEDDPVQRRMMELLLDLLGYDVVCAASNGADLIAFCEAEHADLALLDLDMPYLDGLETAEELSRHGIPVVLITGMPDSGHLVLELEPIAVRLTKPVSAEDLQNAIQIALNTRAKERLE